MGTTAGAPGKHRQRATATSSRSFLRELPVLLFVAIALALLLRTFVMQAFFIPSGSMEQTLQVGDRVIVNKLVYRFRDIHRGDVVVFNGLDSFVQDADVRFEDEPVNGPARALRALRGLMGLGEPGEKDFIKRVIGVPGDVVGCCTDGQVTVNSEPLDEESYVFEDDEQIFEPVVVEPGKIWVMGDHRSRSSDSRANGQVPISRVLGRAVVVVWPASHAKGLRAPATFEGRPYLPTAARVATSPLAMAGVITLTGFGVRRRVDSARRRRPYRRTTRREPPIPEEAE